MVMINPFFKQAGLLLIAAGLCSLDLVAAEPGDKPAAPQQPPPTRANIPLARPQPPGGLTPEQRTELRKALDENRDNIKAMDQKLSDARRALNEALFADPYEEAVARQKAETVAKLDVERTLLRAKALDKIRPSLTAAQRERLKIMPLDVSLAPSAVREERPRPPAGFSRPPSGQSSGVSTPPAPATKPKEDAVK